MKNERKKIMKREHKWVKWVRGSSSFLLFVHHFIVGCVLCSSFFHSCFNSRAYFGSLVIEAWIKKEEEQRTQHQTQSCYLLFFALSFVFLSLQWFVMKARNHVKRKRNTKHKGKHHVLCFFLLSTNSRFISSLRWCRMKNQKNRKNKWNENKRSACFFHLLLLCSFPFFIGKKNQIKGTARAFFPLPYRRSFNLGLFTLVNENSPIWRTCCVLCFLLTLA